ncbi:hypothetical protein TGRUB_299160A, partial [Toxoplasma gondii RUB]
MHRSAPNPVRRVLRLSSIY